MKKGKEHIISRSNNVDGSNVRHFYIKERRKHPKRLQSRFKFTLKGHISIFLHLHFYNDFNFLCEKCSINCDYFYFIQQLIDNQLFVTIRSLISDAAGSSVWPFSLSSLPCLSPAWEAAATLSQSREMISQPLARP